MRTAKEWVAVIHPVAHIGAEGELERQIARIQADALGITLLDAKWLDPECHQRCQSLVLKNKIESLQKERDEALRLFNEQRDELFETRKQLAAAQKDRSGWIGWSKTMCVSTNLTGCIRGVYQ